MNILDTATDAVTTRDIVSLRNKRERVRLLARLVVSSSPIGQSPAQILAWYILTYFKSWRPGYVRFNAVLWSPDVTFQRDYRKETFAKTSIERWCVWCESVNVDCLPANADSIRRYREYCITLSESASSLNKRISAVAYLHNMVGLKDPLANERSDKQDIIAIAQHEALRIDFYKRLECLIKIAEESLSAMGASRCISMALLGAIGGFRLEDLVKLRVSDLLIDKDYIFVKHGLGATIVAPRATASFDVGDFLQRFIAEDKPLEGGYIFRSRSLRCLFRSYNNHEKYAKDKQIGDIRPMNISTASRCILPILSQCGFKLGFSFRSYWPIIKSAQLSGPVMASFEKSSATRAIISALARKHPMSFMIGRDPT